MAAVPGSLFRRILFWSHLAAGLSAGLFIFIMSITGVLLTYEHQMLDAAGRRNHVDVPAEARRLPADELARAARAASPQESPPVNLVFIDEPGAPVTASRGRAGSVILNPYTAEVIPDAAAGLRDFFRVVEAWHRRMGGENSSVRAWLIDYGNLLFLFIVLSGIYIWLPGLWRWPALRFHMFFQKKYLNSKVRDFNWHHVLAFWMLIPLLLISLSGVVMSFPWANQLVYAAYGEQAPQRRGPPGPSGPQGTSEATAGRGGERNGGESSAAGRASLDLEAMRTAAAAQVSQWQRMTIPLAARGPRVQVAVELKSDLPRAPRQTVTFNAADGSVERVSEVQGSASQSPGQRARSWLRLVHTGEQYGLIGQTIAGIASLAACFLVYTGWALAYRRLLKPLFQRRTRLVTLKPVTQD